MGRVCWVVFGKHGFVYISIEGVRLEIRNIWMVFDFDVY